MIHTLNQFFLMVVSASALPLLAVIAISLRRNFFTGKIKILFLSLGIIFLAFSLQAAIRENGGVVSIRDVVTGIIFSGLTFFILSKYNHTHTHDAKDEGAKGIVISEAFHSLTDGAVIGATYLLNPIIGYAATIGIITHELPKMIGTLTIFRSLGLSIRQTILYGICAQIGSPVAAILVYVLGTRIPDENLQGVEIASLASLATIILWIMWLEMRFHLRHKHDHTHHDHTHDHSES